MALTYLGFVFSWYCSIFAGRVFLFDNSKVPRQWPQTFITVSKLCVCLPMLYPQSLQVYTNLVLITYEWEELMKGSSGNFNMAFKVQCFQEGPWPPPPWPLVIKKTAAWHNSWIIVSRRRQAVSSTLIERTICALLLPSIVFITHIPAVLVNLLDHVITMSPGKHPSNTSWLYMWKSFLASFSFSFG